MATISSTGIGSGLDVNGIVRQLIAIQSRPLSMLQSAKTGLNTQLSAIGGLQSRMSSLRDAANALTSLTLWGQRVGTSSDPAAVRVSVGNGTPAGSYAVQVAQLAAAQTVASRAFGGSDATLGEGTLTIELGRWDGEPAPTGFTPKAGSTAVAITIGPGETSLAAIRDKINAADAGVTASIVNDASGARLALRSSATGEDNAFRVAVVEDDGVAEQGLSALAYDALAASPMQRTQAAANARATINGIEVTSASNSFDGVADGMSLTVQRVTAAAVEVGVAPDTDAVKTAITNFVNTFNDVASYIREQTKYDEANKKGATLQGDRVVVTLQSQLRALFNQDSSASSVFARMSDIGIAFKADGTLETMSGPLNNALEKLPELRRLLAADGPDSASSGFAERIKDFAAAVLGSDGAFETRNASLRRQITSNEKWQDAMQQRLAQSEERLRRQYQLLDSNMAQLGGLSNYLVQQLATLNRKPF